MTTSPKAPVHPQLQNLRVDDWLVLGEDDRGHTFYIITEMWPEWGETGEGPNSRIPDVLAKAAEVPLSGWRSA